MHTESDPVAGPLVRTKVNWMTHKSVIDTNLYKYLLNWHLNLIWQLTTEVRTHWWWELSQYLLLSFMVGVRVYCGIVHLKRSDQNIVTSLIYGCCNFQQKLCLLACCFWQLIDCYIFFRTLLLLYWIWYGNQYICCNICHSICNSILLHIDCIRTRFKTISQITSR